jgi:twitching motility protein PilU
MLNTPSIADRIRKNEIHLIKDYMLRSNEEGMQTFDQALYKLYGENIISYDSALKYADSENDIRLLIKLQK